MEGRWGMIPQKTDFLEKKAGAGSGAKTCDKRKQKREDIPRIP